MPKIIAYIALVLISGSCGKKHIDEKAFQIVEKSIAQHGGKNYQDMNVSFDFRQFKVHLKQKEGVFLYERTFKDSLNNEVHDVLTNNSFSRIINNKKQDLTAKENDKYKEGLNAIAYFALLPYKLFEPAVILNYLGETTIENKKYDKIAVSFEEASGGKDHLDEFCYWINRNDHTMDYLSYSNGGPRFRKAIKRTQVDGITFQDYENYEVLDSTLSAFNYDKAFATGRVKLLSKIEQFNYVSNKSAKK
ncbi:MAG: DUF6503 family protein [Segetibacter sp.]